jgi:phenylacetate-CoA ligase
MKSSVESLYLQSPPSLQNLALTLYGLRLNLIRHRGNYSKHFRTVNNQFNFDQKTLTEHVNVLIQRTVNEAKIHVPYYRALFDSCKLESRDILTADDLNKIPLLEKKALRENPSSFINEKFNGRRLLCVHTTGTTGTPLNIYCDKEARQLNYAFYDRFLSKNGINYRGSRATFGGRIIVPNEQMKPPFWRYSYFQKNLLMSSYHLTDKNISEYINQLIKFRPDYIDAYPSSLYTITKYAQDHNLNLKDVTKGITTSAETLFSDQRTVIESVFGVPIFDQYGAAEMCVFAGQCSNGNYHIHTDYGFLEFLREDGSRAKPGEEAELVCTGFINPVMPLIRYRIGDRGVLSERQCICGSAFPVLDKIIGRTDDVILTPDGRRVGRLSPVLKGFPVKEAQYIQRRKESVTILVVKDIGYTEKTDASIITELQKRLGSEIALEIQHVSSITRCSGGKLKTVVSYL